MMGMTVAVKLFEVMMRLTVINLELRVEKKVTVRMNMKSNVKLVTVGVKLLKVVMRVTVINLELRVEKKMTVRMNMKSNMKCSNTTDST